MKHASMKSAPDCYTRLLAGSRVTSSAVLKAA